MKIVIRIFILLLLPWIALSQNADYQISIASYGENDGLSNKDVFCINKDARGLLWVGTRFGLNRFDGRAFRVFTTKEGLKSNFVSAMFPLTERHWLLGFGIPAVQPENIVSFQVFDTYSYEVLDLTDLFPDLPFSEKRIQRITYLKNGFLFTLGSGKKFFLSEAKRWISVDFLEQEEQLVAFIPDMHALGLLLTGERPVLTKRDGYGKILWRMDIPEARKDVRWLRSDARGNDYFIYSANERRTSHLVKITPNGQQEIVRTFHDGYYFFRPETMNYHTKIDGYWALNDTAAFLLSENGDVRWNLPIALGNFIDFGRHNFFEEGLIWQCASSGLQRINFSPQRFKTLFRDTKYSSFRGIARVGNRILFATEGKLYEKSAYRSDVFMELQGLASVAVSDSVLWLGGFKNLQRVNTRNKKNTRYPIYQNEIWSIWQDAKGNIWFSERGIQCFNPNTGQTEPISYAGFEEIETGTIYHFYPISDQITWLCSTMGLYELDVRQKKITARYWSGGKGKYYLPTDDIRHLYRDKKTGELWLATGQDGLLYWQPKTGEIRLSRLPGRATNITHGIYADDDGFLWLSTDDGIVQWQRKTGKYRIYRTPDGLATNEFNRISHFQDTDGTLYFGSINGLTTFHPKDFKATFDQGLLGAPFVVEVQQYNGKSETVEEKTAAYLSQRSLILRPSDQFFTLSLAIADYRHAAGAVYLYQIKGDATWQQTDNNQFTFWRLPYGRQTILVKALLPDGSLSEVLEVKVWVKPPFYLRWWFVLLGIAAIGALIFFRLNVLRRRNLRLEQEVARRTEKMAQQAAELRQLDQMKSQFFANISHELRTPLTLIASPLQRLMQQEEDPGKKQFLLFAAKNSQRLLRMVNEILDLTKLEASKLSVDEDPVQVVYFLRRIAAEFESFAVHKGIDLQVETNLTEDVVSIFDIKKVETILYNLISNALKFTSGGGRVVLRVQEKDNGLAFEVIDTGRGIASEDLPHIFGRFYQAKTQKAAEGGTGIGLALSKELATLMRGQIHVKSVLGQGSAFLFELPCQLSHAEAAPSDSELAEVPSVHSLPTPEPEEGLPHILLVEDNEDLQRYILLLLQQDYRLTIVNNGKAALAHLESCTVETRPALIVSDVMMPEMDGFQLLHQLKSTPGYRHIPVVMLTARSSQDDKIAALRIGVDDYLTKPFLEEELRVRIQNLISRANLREQFRSIVQETYSPTEQRNTGIAIRDAMETSDNLPDSEWLTALERYILDHLDDPTFSVATVAEAFDMSRFKFTRAVNLAVGMTAVDYVQEIRLCEARRMLEANPNLSVKEVAMAVGFANPKLFSRKFQQRFGVYPSQL